MAPRPGIIDLDAGPPPCGSGDPNATDVGVVQALRDAGFDDTQIVAITVFVALRVAFSTVNDALGARPDHALASRNGARASAGTPSPPDDELPLPR